MDFLEIYANCNNLRMNNKPYRWTAIKYGSQSAVGLWRTLSPVFLEEKQISIKNNLAPKMTSEKHWNSPKTWILCKREYFFRTERNTQWQSSRIRAGNRLSQQLRVWWNGTVPVQWEWDNEGLWVLRERRGDNITTISQLYLIFFVFLILKNMNKIINSGNHDPVRQRISQRPVTFCVKSQNFKTCPFSHFWVEVDFIKISSF